ncbi:hypothetical protein D3C81_2324640 [compost metagenome]
MPCTSARLPSPAAPIPPMPNIRPNIRPDTMPTRPGTASWAYTTSAANAEDITSPITTASTAVPIRLA